MVGTREIGSNGRPEEEVVRLGRGVLVQGKAVVEGEVGDYGIVGVGGIVGKGARVGEVRDF